MAIPKKNGPSIENMKAAKTGSYSHIKSNHTPAIIDPTPVRRAAGIINVIKNFINHSFV